MRVLVAAGCLVLLCTFPALAQQALPSAPEPVGWGSVQSLGPGVSLYVKAPSRHLSCRLQSVDAESLHCGNGADLTFQRSEIKSIKRPHRGRSTLAGFAIGVGVGAIVGAASGSSCTTQQRNSFLGCFAIITRGDTALIGATVFGLVGVPVGYFTDFTRSTVYKSK